jgi:hypothetical protein
MSDISSPGAKSGNFQCFENNRNRSSSCVLCLRAQREFINTPLIKMLLHFTPTHCFYLSSRCSQEDNMLNVKWKYHRSNLFLATHAQIDTVESCILVKESEEMR